MVGGGAGVTDDRCINGHRGGRCGQRRASRVVVL
jgi:hypothetical protein